MTARPGVTAREALAEHLYTNYRDRLDRDWLELSVARRGVWLNRADQALAVLAEHGDTQQVREELLDALFYVNSQGETRFRWGSDRPVHRGHLIDEVMAVVAPIVAARDAAAEDLRAWQESHKEQAERRNRAENRAERAEADLAAARQQLDQVRAEVQQALASYSMPINPSVLARILDAPARPAGHDESGQ